jgi:hypothetical protein
MYLKIVTVKTKYKVYHYVRIIERFRRHFLAPSQEKVIATLGTAEEVKKSAYLLIAGLQRLQNSTLSTEPGLKCARQTTDKKVPAQVRQGRR